MLEKTNSGFRISPQQKHLWSLQKGQYSQSYYCQSALHIKGKIEKSRLELAVNNVIKRHEILRTKFRFVDGMIVPLQFITEARTPLFNDYDLSNLNHREQITEIDTLFQKLGLHSFNVEEDLPVHISLAKLSLEEHIMFISLPALCADMATLNNLVREICSSYEASLSGLEMPEDCIQYAEISEWLNELIEAEDTETGRDFWQAQTIYHLIDSKLSFENHLLQDSKFEPKSLTSEIGSDILERIRTISRSYGSEVSTLLLACWHILLWHLTEQSDIIVGTACDGRKYLPLEQAFGLLQKYLPVHSNLSSDSRLGEVIERIYKSLRNIQEQQEYFNWEQLRLANDELCKSSFFPFCFDFEHQNEIYIANNICFSVYRNYYCTEQFKIRLSCVVTDNSLRVTFNYDSSLFSPDSIRCILEQYQALLNSIVNNPEAKISEWKIISDVERDRLLNKLNSTKVDYPEDSCIHQLFEEQVVKTPDNVAVIFESQHLTYRELNERANQLAHYLQKLGVRPEVLVAIHMERSLEMIIGIFGILKAGGAYVPLDVAYPSERLGFMLEDAQVSIILSTQKCLKTIPGHGEYVICLDTDWKLIAQEGKGNPPTQLKSDNLAYIIYTSGSTGKPKGTMILHQGLVNYLSWCTKAYALEKGTGAPVHSSIGFDATITSVFSPLLVGQSIVILPSGGEIEALSSILSAKRNFSFIKITPAHLELLNQTLLDNVCGVQTRAVIIGGEALLAKSLEFWRTYLPETRIINEYGPTETVVGCCIYEVSPDQFPLSQIPIGRPIANTQLYILDRYLQPVAVGIPGELHIGGAGLARGYYNRPDLTAEKFIPDPFSNQTGARLYKTGDLARYLPDGNIEFLGRIDNQVKIRGFRIELGEIEAALSQHPALSQTVVAIEEDGLNKQLIAYVVATQDPAPTADELRNFLKEKLPDYMVPATFILLDTLPLTINGKVERKFLLTLAASKNISCQEFVPARTPTEEVMALIWSEILNLEKVGIYDDFFTIGGDSIRAVQVVHEARNYKLSIKVKDLFEHRNIYALAQYLNNYNDEYKSSAPMELLKIPDSIYNSLPDNIEDAYPVSKMQELILKHYSENDENRGIYHTQQSYYIIDDHFCIEALKKALHIVIKKHRVFRTAFITGSNGQHFQIIKTDIEFTISEEYIQHLNVEEQENYIYLYMQKDRDNLFDVTKIHTPLFRVCIFIRSENSFEFFMSIHHAITDGWGNIEFLKELVNLYVLIRNGEQMAVTQTVDTYKEFVAFEQEILRSQKASNFWKYHIGERAHQYQEIMLMRAENRKINSTSEIYTLGAHTLMDVQRLCREIRVSPKALFLSIYSDLIASNSKKDTVSIGVIESGRSELLSDSLKALGLFWNIVPLFISIKDDKQLQVIKVQQLLIDSQPYVRYPLVKIMEEQSKEELFFASFNFIHFHNYHNLSTDSSIKIQGRKLHDKFHFPLNCIVSIEPDLGNLKIRFEYDSRYFYTEHIKNMLNSYVEYIKCISSVKLNS